jgi:O-antigen/teichoic acid export membrane protein
MTSVLRNFIDVSIVSTILLISAAIFAPQLTMWMYHRQDIGFYSSILFLASAVDIWNSLPLVLLQATRSIKTKVTLEQSANLSFLTLACISLFLGYDITGVVLSQLIMGLFFLIISFVILHRHTTRNQLPGIRDILHVRFADTRPYLGQGLLFAVDKSIGGLFPNGIFFIMSFLASPAIIGFCRIAVKFAQLPRTLVLPQVNDLSLTVLSNIKAKGVHTLRLNAAKLIKHTVALHALMSFGSLIVIPPVMYVLYGKDFIPAIPLTLWLVLFSLPASLWIANAAILRLYRKTHYSILAAILTWPLMIGIFYIFYGLIGPLSAFAGAFLAVHVGSFALLLYIFLVLLPSHERSAA